MDRSSFDSNTIQRDDMPLRKTAGIRAISAPMQPSAIAKIAKRALFSLLLLTLIAPSIDAQTYGSRLGTVKRGGKVSFEPSGPGVLFDALDPTVRKWFIPQELYSEYGWKQWEYSNYARETYQRYV